MSRPSGPAPPSLSVVLPAWNEEPAVGRVVQELRTALDRVSVAWEIVVVDDGSTDRTAEQASAAGATVISRPERGGYGAAVKTGIQVARGEFVALLDADGGHDPADLPRLLDCMGCGRVSRPGHATDRRSPDQSGDPAEGDLRSDECCGREIAAQQTRHAYDQVIGVRTGEAGSLKWLRAPAKWLIRKFAEWIAGRRIPDLNSGIRVFRREVMLKYLWVVPDGFSCSTSMTLAFLSNGHPVKFVPVSYRPRHGRSKFRPMRDGMNYAFTIIRMMTYFRPLRVFVPLALLLGLAALVKGVYDVRTSPTGLADTDVILAVGALLLFGIGLLADLIVAQKRDA